MVKVTTVQDTQSRMISMTGAREITTSITTASSATTPLTPIKDAADFNASFDWGNATGLSTHILDLTTLRGKPVLDHGANAPGTIRWQLDSGVQQDVSDGIITYTFATWNHGVGVSNSPKFGQGQGYSPFTQSQVDAGRIAIGNWDELIAAKFVEIPAGPGASVFGKNNADIVFSNTTTGPAQAEAYYPGLVPYFGSKYQRIQGDVFVADPAINGSNLQFLPGQYGLQTLNHELGHTLGLSHPGSYDFGDDNDGDGVPDPINYTGDAQYFQDSHQYTIMSYFDSYETGAQNIDWNVMRFLYPSTPMVDDVFVIQQKYGADMTTRTGNSTYGFNSTADVTNAAMKFNAGELATIFTIWDAKGTDTLDLSGYYTPSVIDLREGAYSSAGGFGAYNAAQAALNVDSLSKAEFLSYINPANAGQGLGARTAVYDLYFGGRPGVNEGIAWNVTTDSVGKYVMEQNIGIAYGAVIENAIGGHGNDRINGNQADNSFRGNAGADTFILADYTGDVLPVVTGGTKTITDLSVDTIEDFQTGVDKLDLSEFGITEANVLWNNATDTLLVDGNFDGDYTDAVDATFIVHGSDIVSGDYIFA